MRYIIITILLAIPAAGWAQSGRINIDIPQSLALKAVESVDVNLDGAMLRLASKFLTDDDRNVRDVVRKLEGVYVHSYEFDSDGAYDRSIIDRVRTQLGADWKRIVTVQSRTRDHLGRAARADNRQYRRPDRPRQAGFAGRAVWNSEGDQT